MSIELGRRLLSAGAVHPSEIEAGLYRHLIAGMPFVRAMLELGHLSEQALEQELARCLVPVLSTIVPLPALVDELPTQMCRRLMAVPVRRDPRTGLVDVAAVDPFDVHIAHEFSYQLKSEVRILRGALVAIEQALVRIDRGEYTASVILRKSVRPPGYAAPSIPPAQSERPIPLVRKAKRRQSVEVHPVRDVGGPPPEAGNAPGGSAVPHVPLPPSMPSFGGGRPPPVPRTRQQTAPGPPGVPARPPTPAPPPSVRSRPEVTSGSPPSARSRPEVASGAKGRSEPSARPPPPPRAPAVSSGPSGAKGRPQTSAGPPPAPKAPPPPRAPPAPPKAPAAPAASSSAPRTKAATSESMSASRARPEAAGAAQDAPRTGKGSGVRSSSQPPSTTRGPFSPRAPAAPFADIRGVLAAMESATTRDDVIDCLIVGMSTVARRVGVFAVKKGCYRGVACNAELGDSARFRTIEISAEATTVLGIAATSGSYLGPLPVTQPHEDLLTLMKDASTEVAAVLIRVAGRPAVILFADALGDTMIATRRAEELGHEASLAFSRILTDAKASRGRA